MTRYPLTVDEEKGVIDAPTTEWSPDEITLLNVRTFWRRVTRLG